MRTVSKQSVVITCSGAVVRPASIKAQCATCGGFDSQLARCSHPTCGVALCRLHQKLFTLAPSPLIFCDKHFCEATKSFDTWQAYDRKGIQPRRTS
jgi:hypothetical protein